MLRIGLTGGIAAGKSTVAARLRVLGADVVDADVLAREAVAPGTDGLAAIRTRFGAAVIAADGTLDRPALGRIVFDDDEARNDLNDIVHPAVRDLYAARLEQLPPERIVVHDVPLLVENAMSADYHLVINVDAPEHERIRRMRADRGMSADEAAARIAAQADDRERGKAADVRLRNEGDEAEVLEQVGQLWHDRLLPFNANLLAGRCAERRGGPILHPYDPTWPDQAERLGARIRRECGPAVLVVDHIGSTAVPGLPAKDVIDLQVSVADRETLDTVREPLARAGFPRKPGIWQDTPKPADPDPDHWVKRFHANADPLRMVNVHVRVVGTPGWRYALAFRDWLRAEDDWRSKYLAVKRAAAAEHAADPSTAGYAEAKEPWFSVVADPAVNAWTAATGWRPPS
ncbi:dephospho-CoA kinase [Spelaeicoccus albus]|uniref:Dephospho-CoA kinase n=1 Tax=Spelaeicoccus albus TaxID=1280376 RepID=A0A7Z0IIJ2_9MICO|nr:dephospho-CoA kinase [Spelaeicoccus albus]NYI68568.1 dephospho-CoA kinase [Spelaeicoccus albus]